MVSAGPAWIGPNVLSGSPRFLSVPHPFSIKSPGYRCSLPVLADSPDKSYTHAPSGSHIWSSDPKEQNFSDFTGPGRSLVDLSRPSLPHIGFG
ncbi:hypothetical protein IX51_10705 [uncultured archaeon]|nr:hypothetical protein IX51_10705 [uncultured archaeon]